MITSTIETITPAIAQNWLDASKTENRPFSQAVISSYADTMKKGNWLLNGEAITFDEKGNLLNGHHRLKAVIASASNIQSFVVRGVTSKAFSTFDCGRNRTFGQLITMQGCINGNNTAAILRLYLALKNGNEMNNYGSYDLIKNLHETNKSMMDFFLKNKTFFEDITSIASSVCGKARLLNASFVGGSIAYLIKDCGYKKENVVEFFTQLCSVDTAKNNTINILRRRLSEDRNNRKDRLLSKIHSALSIKCWNAVMTKKTVKIFNWNRETEGFPKYLKANEI